MLFKDLCKSSIFDRTYWGQFEVDIDNRLEATLLARRRDTFTNLYDLDKHITNLQKPTIPELDHIEMYKCKSGHLYLVCSIYQDVDLSIHYFMQIDKLYSKNATTWCRMFFTTKDYKSWLKSL
jgi:hypothetical protein